MSKKDDVKAVFPTAVCEPLHNQPGPADGYEILTGYSVAEAIGTGKTELEAWEDAANRIKAV